MKRAAVVAILFGIVVLAIGRDGHGTSAQAAVKQALARTVDADSSRFTISWITPVLPVQFPYDNSVHGVMDYVHHRGRISYGFGNEMLLDGDVTYEKWPMPWRHDSPWMRFETDSQETDPLDLYDRAISNPMGLLSFLTGASDDVRTVGSDDVLGTTTRHYEGILDLQKVVDRAPPAKRAELQEWLDFMREYEPTTVPFGLWVDSDGIARRLRIDASEGAGSVVIEYYDFGVPVEITPPPASEIMSMEEFFAEMQQHAQDSDCDEDGTDSDDSSSDGSGDVEPGGDSSSPNVTETYAEKNMDATIGGSISICIDSATSGTAGSDDGD